MATKSQLARAATKTAQTILTANLSRDTETGSIRFLSASCKKLGIFALTVGLLSLSVNVGAQNIQKDASGNYHQTAKTAIEPLKTANTFTTAKGETFIVWTGARGAKFVVRTSKKTGKTYRQYIKVK